MYTEDNNMTAVAQNEEVNDIVVESVPQAETTVTEHDKKAVVHGAKKISFRQ